VYLAKEKQTQKLFVVKRLKLPKLEKKEKENIENEVKRSVSNPEDPTLGKLEPPPHCGLQGVISGPQTGLQHNHGIL
jgi:hypothetical protein